MIFNIQRYSIQDGPGIRSTVFLKGCPLSCQWCSNPESQRKEPELMFRQRLCNLCSKCLPACQQNAISVNDGQLNIERSSCDTCGACVGACDRNAFSVVGKIMTADEVLDELLRDVDFYRNSGGGITVSGGEPLTQPDFAAALFEECQKHGVHTCLDTCGYSSPDSLQKVIPYMDMALYDLKHMDSAAHERLTGVPNEPILANARLIDAANKEIVIRIPLIPGRNTSDENLIASARFAASLKNVSRIDILPYHRYGEGKYTALGREYPLVGLSPPTSEDVEHWRALIGSYGLSCRVEG